MTTGEEREEAQAARPLSGRHAVVTGGGRGIGAAIATELARLGADLTLTSRNLALAENHAFNLADQHHVRAQARRLDVTEFEQLKTVFEEVQAALGPALILVNNAGIALSMAFEKSDLEHWHQHLEVNVLGAVACAQAVLPAMREADWGRIVNVASTSGLIGYPRIAAYSASKHALVGLTRSLALELARTGITVNAVCPSYTETDMSAAAIANLVKGGRTEDEALAILTRRNPQARLVQPEEVAQAVGWLALPSSTAVTGQSIAVAGGEVM